MDVAVTVKYNVLKEIYVHSLGFNPSKQRFYMNYQSGFGIGHKIDCQLASIPTALEAFGNKYRINFDDRKDAEAFCKWLIDSEKIADEGYRSMKD